MSFIGSVPVLLIRSLAVAAAAAAIVGEPLLTLPLPCPGRRDTNTFLNVITPSPHFGTIADSNTTFSPEDLVR